MSKSQICDNCLRGLHHELQIIENCACPCSTTIKDEHPII